MIRWKMAANILPKVWSFSPPDDTSYTSYDRRDILSLSARLATDVPPRPLSAVEYRTTPQLDGPPGPPSDDELYGGGIDRGDVLMADASSSTASMAGAGVSGTFFSEED